MKLVLSIDLERCTGCRACEAACKLENRLIEGVFRNRVYWTAPAEPRGRFEFTVAVCQQCSRPACLRACGSNAISKHPDTGVVVDRRRPLYRMPGMRAGVPVWRDQLRFPPPQGGEVRPVRGPARDRSRRARVCRSVSGPGHPVRGALGAPAPGAHGESSHSRHRSLRPRSIDGLSGTLATTYRFR